MLLALQLYQEPRNCQRVSRRQKSGERKKQSKTKQNWQGRSFLVRSVLHMMVNRTTTKGQTEDKVWAISAKRPRGFVEVVFVCWFRLCRDITWYIAINHAIWQDTIYRDTAALSRILGDAIQIAYPVETISIRITTNTYCCSYIIQTIAILLPQQLHKFCHEPRWAKYHVIKERRENPCCTVGRALVALTEIAVITVFMPNAMDHARSFCRFGDSPWLRPSLRVLRQTCWFRASSSLPTGASPNSSPSEKKRCTSDMIRPQTSLALAGECHVPPVVYATLGEDTLARDHRDVLQGWIW